MTSQRTQSGVRVTRTMKQDRFGRVQVVRIPGWCWIIRRNTYGETFVSEYRRRHLVDRQQVESFRDGQVSVNLSIDFVAGGWRK